MVTAMSKRNLSISNFKENILFWGKFLLFLTMIIIYVNRIIFPQYSGEYTSSLTDKVNRLESIDGAKIVLLGDSNLAFGINSALMEEALGMPVVNMGLHGGAGNPFHEEMSKFNVQEGDIYIICHSSFADEDTIGEMYAWISLENHYNLWKILRPKDIMPMIKSFPYYLKKCLNLYASGTGNTDNGGVYSRSAFNEYGDIGLIREGTEYDFSSKIKVSSINETTVNRINELSEYLEEHGATLLVAGYPIGNGRLTADANEFIEFQKDLKKQLDCAVISNYVDYMFDYTYFYNTDLHLNTEGADIRTLQLISDIEKWQLSKSDADMNSDIYENIIEDANLSHITDMCQYFSTLLDGKDRYTIFISAKDDMPLGLNEEIAEYMQKLGLKAFVDEKYQASYLAIIDKGNVSELMGYELLETFGQTSDGNIQYSVQSAGHNCGNVSSINLNGWEYSKNHQGLNIVVYSNESHRILDEVTFDTGIQEIIAIR